MRNFLWFIIGLLCGVLVMMMREGDSTPKEAEEVVEVVDVQNENKPLPGVTMFETPQGNVPVKVLRIEQISESGAAIATEVDNFGTSTYIERDIKVLLLPKEGENFYSKQIIQLSSNQQALRVGEYKSGGRIYPVVRITRK